MLGLPLLLTRSGRRSRDYAVALRDHEALARARWERVVLDEAQNVKSIEAKQTRAIRTL